MERRIGPYHLLELIGRGGMGEVWRATDERNGREVAIKLLSSAALADPELAERFRRECRIAGRIHYPHILPVYDFSEGDPSYIVMPYVRGTDLATVLKNNGTLPLERTVNIIEQVASALDVARRSGLHHRDVKPSNIMLEQGAHADHVWLFDWSTVRPIDTSGSALAIRVAHLVGTPAYIAPERLSASATPDHRADVYSLAVVLYECLAGHKPFDGEDTAVLTAQVLRDPPALPGYVPVALQEVVAKGLAKNPDERWQSAGELAAAARGAVGSVGPRPESRAYVPVASPNPAIDLAGITGGWLVGAVIAIALVLPLTGVVDAAPFSLVFLLLGAGGVLGVVGVRGARRLARLRVRRRDLAEASGEHAAEETGRAWADIEDSFDTAVRELELLLDHRARARETRKPE